jgi:hypothetical protein
MSLCCIFLPMYEVRKRTFNRSKWRQIKFRFLEDVSDKKMKFSVDFSVSACMLCRLVSVCVSCCSKVTLAVHF